MQARLTALRYERGTSTTQVKRYTCISESEPCSRAFITFGKQTVQAKQCGDSTQAHVFVIY